MPDARERLIAALTAAQHSQDDDGDTVERSRTRKSLAALQDFLRDIDIPLVLRADLHKLDCALEDASVGRSNTLTEPATMARGTPTKKTYETNRETLAAAAVEILKRGGWKVDAAVSYAARGFRMDAKELANYRKNMTGKKIKGNAADSYSYWINEWKRSERPPLDCVQSLIEIARQFDK